ncbi:hypothetical protein JHK87_047649 [Glycine soja]|nr:hypothetical protein JHK87_047649 [Glycine soja]
MEAMLKRLKRDFDSQRKKLTKTRRELGEIKRENQQKSRECQEAWNSLKELQNKLMHKSMHVGSLGNIRVFCRCRPLNTDEIYAGATVTLDFESAKDGDLTVMSNGAPKRTFKFDVVFGPQDEQATHGGFGAFYTVISMLNDARSFVVASLSVAGALVCQEVLAKEPPLPEALPSDVVLYQQSSDGRKPRKRGKKRKMNTDWKKLG